MNLGMKKVKIIFQPPEDEINDTETTYEGNGG